MAVYAFVDRASFSRPAETFCLEGRQLSVAAQRGIRPGNPRCNCHADRLSRGTVKLVCRTGRP